jgi:hypothetical protein
VSSINSVQPPDHLPRTFLEWGVAVPFTTPLLSSGRVRPGRRGRPEMIMPNPSGGRGLYVFDLAAAPEVATLTVHDRLLLERLLALPAVTPSEIRKAAREIALEGAAGRKAARVAAAAADADEALGLLTRFHLVTCLLQQVGLQSIDWGAFTGNDRELRAAIRGSLAEVAPKLGTPVDGLFEQIEVIADMATPVGPVMKSSASRNDAMLARLQTLTASLRQWSAGESGAAAVDARAVLDVAQRTVRDAGDAQLRARELLDDAMGLLRAWRQPDGERLRTILTRPEWLLDGWAQVCGFWESVVRDERAAQREMLQQMRASLPMLEPGDRSSIGTSVALADLRFDRGRRVKLHEDWRTGLTIIDDRARAEMLRVANA